VANMPNAQDCNWTCALRNGQGGGPSAAAEMHGHFIKALIGNDDSRRWMTRSGYALKASAEGVGTSGGFLVPDSFVSAIIRSVDSYSAFTGNADIINTTSDKVDRPRATGRLTAAWTTEGSTIASSDAVLDDVSLTLRKLAILVKSSNELYQDSASDLAGWLTDEAALAFGTAIDTAGFQGDGSATYSGMRGLANMLTGTSLVDAASGHNSFASIDSSDCGNLISAIQGSAIVGSKWYVSPQAYGAVLCRLSVAFGGLAVDAQGQPTFLGFPVVTTPAAPTSGSTGAAMIYFGNLKRCAILAQRHAMSVAASQRVGLERDQTWWRMTWRCAINIHETTGQMAALVGHS
jgi:HK97 family phage major capsid protein